MIRRVIRKLMVLSFKRKTGKGYVSYATGFRMDNTVAPNDIIIAGYPKSGNTWFRQLSIGAFHGIPLDSLSDDVVQHINPDIDRQRLYSRPYPTMLFKTHALPKPEYRRVVYLVRDGRDAIVSWRCMFEKKGIKIPWRSFLSDPSSSSRFSWGHHLAEWNQNRHRAEILVIRYEDLLKDTVNELLRFCKFAGVSRSREELQSIAEMASFERSKERERLWGVSTPDWPQGKSFHRQGKAGAFERELPDDVKTKFESLYGNWLDHYGYRTTSE